MTTDHPVVLITGASRGLGRALAACFAAEGWRLVLTARGQDDLARAARELAGSTVLALPGDVADPQHAAHLVRSGIERFGRIDVLVNNASTIGPSPMPPLGDYPLPDLAEVFRVNVLAPLHLAQLVLPVMRRQGGGTIVDISSDAAINAYPGWGGYGASKAALDQISRVLAVEQADAGIRVLAIDPGDMNTDLHRLAEPGIDLSHLPGPEVPAPAIMRLILDPKVPSGRYEAMAVATGGPG